MRRLLFTGAALALAATWGGAHLAQAKNTAPYVVVTGAQLVSTGACSPGQTALFTYRLTLKNTGNAPHVPMKNGVGGGTAMMCEKPYPLQWCGKQDGLTPALQPGQSTTVLVRIPYDAGDPPHMIAVQNHPFLTFVTLPNDVNGSPNANGPVVNISAPQKCTLLKIPHP
jgi:hypothetical protein